MNTKQGQSIIMWGNVPLTVNTTIDALLHMACSVNVNYTPGGIHMSITRLGRGQAYSGVDEGEILSELLLRMITEGDLPALPVEEVKDAGEKVQEHQTTKSVRSPKEKGL